MLSRLADHLYWMSRYIERAENTARMLDVQHQASMLPNPAADPFDHWRAVLEITELQPMFAQRGLASDGERVLRFMVTDPENPSSIYSCLTAARENARAVRVVLTTDIWEVVNTMWLDMRALFRDPSWIRDPNKIFDWVKVQSHLFRGVMIGTLLKDEAFFFCRMGTFIERADNTARILDVKYVAHRNQESQNQDRADYYFWASVLRSVSAFEIYRKVYRDAITPLRIAELLIQRGDMPRSLLACLNELTVNLEQVSPGHGARALRMAGRLRADLQYLLVDAEFESQIHDFLTDFLVKVNQLGQALSEEFLVPLTTSD